MDENGDRQSAVLLEDLKHFGESLWRNDEIGEKRFSFFVTIVTAVVGGLAALHTAEQDLKVDVMRISQAAVAGLLLLGGMTYLRMLQRNRVTREYQQTLKYIRDQLIKLGAGPEHYKVPRTAASWLIFRAGLAEASALVCGILLALLLVLLDQSECAAVIGGSLLFAFLATVAQFR